MEIKLEVRNKTISGLKWTALSKFLTQLFTWISTIYIIRILSPDDYGLLSLASILLNFLTLLYEMGLGSALIQAKNITKKEIKNTFGFILILNIILFIITFLLAKPISTFFNTPEVIPLIQALSFRFILVAFSVIPSSLLLREMRFKSKSLLDMISNIIGSAVTLCLAIAGYGVWSLIFGSYAISITGLILLYIYKPYFCIPSFNFKQIKTIMYFGGIVTLERMLWYFYTQADNIIIGKILGKESLGLYSVAMDLSSLPMQKLNSIINQVAFPAFSQLQEDNTALSKAIGSSIHYISFLAFPIFFGLFITTPEFIPVILGDKWQTIKTPIMILSLIMPLRMISNIFPTFLRGIGKPLTSLINLVIYCTVLPFAFYIGGTTAGLNGICFAWLITYPILFSIEILLTFKSSKIPISIFFKETYQPAFASLLMMLLVFYIKNWCSIFIDNTELLFSIEVITGLFVYLITIKIMRKNIYSDLFNLIRG